MNGLAWLVDPFTTTFMQRALVSSLAVGIAAPAIGVWAVSRRLVYLTDAMSHAILAGVAGAALLGVSLVIGGIAAGLFMALLVALLVIPNVMSSLESWLDGPSAQLIDSDGTRTDVSGGAYGVLDIWGPMPWAGLVAAVMLVIVVWWAVGTHAGGNPTRALAKTQSPVNSLSVVAFVLAWIPLTAIPGVVLGHMAYDQIVDGDTDQRGLGLSRWAIVLGYLSLVGALLLGYNVWAK